MLDVDSVSVSNIVEAFMQIWAHKKSKRRKKQSIWETSGNSTIKDTGVGDDMKFNAIDPIRYFNPLEVPHSINATYTPG